MTYFAGEGLMSSACFMSRDFVRFPLFSWITPFFTHLSMIEKVSGMSFWASSLSLLAMASLVFFIWIRRIDLFLRLIVFLRRLCLHWRMADL